LYLYITSSSIIVLYNSQFSQLVKNNNLKFRTNSASTNLGDIKNTFFDNIIIYFNNNIENNLNYQYLQDYDIQGMLAFGKSDVRVKFGTKLNDRPNVRLTEITRGYDEFFNEYFLYQEYKREIRPNGKIHEVYKASWFLLIENKDQGLFWYKINNF
jgi:hypothetical protein